jgi:dihydroflavonol-4-reductase
VRILADKGIKVRASARSRAKAEKQFGSLNVEAVSGDITDPATFADGVPGMDVVFHTAAYFLDNYKGGKHWDQRYNTDLIGTARLMERCYEAGVRRFGHTSSSAVLQSRPGEPVDETALRTEVEAAING